MPDGKPAVYIFVFGISPTQSAVPVYEMLGKRGDIDVFLVSNDPTSRRWLGREGIPFLPWERVLSGLPPQPGAGPAENANGSARALFRRFAERQACRNLDLLEDRFLELWVHGRRRVAQAAAFWEHHDVRLTVHLDDILALDTSIIQEGARRGLPSVILQHGYHITEKYLPEVRTADLPFRFLSGEYDRQCCLRAGYDPSRLRVTGQPRFDHLSALEPATREALARKHAVDLRKRRILLLSGFFEDLCREAFPRIARELRGLGDGVQLLVKQHPREAGAPSRAFEEEGLDVRWFRNEDVQELVALADAMIHFGSTVTIEAVLVGCPVVYVQNAFFDASFHEDPVITTLPSVDGLAAGLARAMQRREEADYPTLRETFVRKYNHRDDGRASERVAHGLLDLLAAHRTPSGSPTPGRPEPNAQTRPDPRHARPRRPAHEPARRRGRHGTARNPEITRGRR